MIRMILCIIPSFSVDSSEWISKGSILVKDHDSSPGIYSAFYEKNFNISVYYSKQQSRNDEISDTQLHNII